MIEAISMASARLMRLLSPFSEASPLATMRTLEVAWEATVSSLWAVSAFWVKSR